MTPDRLMVGLGLALSTFLQNEQDEEHPFAYVLILTEHGHAGDGSDLTPVNTTAHNLDREDVIALLRQAADSMERALHGAKH